MNILETIISPIKLSQASPEIVKAVQERLGIEVDGICGVQTILSFHGFKKRHFLADSDYLGATTAKKLLEVNLSKLITEVQAEAIFGRQITQVQLNDLNNCLQRFEINTKSRLTHFLSQIAHESCGLKYLEELATGAAYEGRKDLGNNQTGDGRRFKGAGALQVTGRANYQALCNYLNDPRVMEGCRYVAATYPFTSAGFFWWRNNLNKAIDSGGNIYRVTKIINGGLNGIEDRKRHYERVCKIITS